MTPSERQGMLQVISDLSKDAYGFRVRLAYDEMSDDELQKTWDRFNDDLELAMVREASQKLRAQREWEARIADLIEIGAGDEATAIRWDMQATNDEGQFVADPGYYCYLNDLDYALEHRIKEALT